MNKRRRYKAKQRRHAHQRHRYTVTASRCGIVTLLDGTTLRAHAASLDGLILAVEDGRIYTSDDADKQHLLFCLEALR